MPIKETLTRSNTRQIWQHRKVEHITREDFEFVTSQEWLDFARYFGSTEHKASKTEHISTSPDGLRLIIWRNYD